MRRSRTFVTTVVVGIAGMVTGCGAGSSQSADGGRMDGTAAAGDLSTDAAKPPVDGLTDLPISLSDVGGTKTDACTLAGGATGAGCVIAGGLTGLRWELPCTSSGSSCSCPALQTQTATVEGTGGQSYDITLHFRGIVEEKTYTGQADGGAGPQIVASGGVNSNLFISGGIPDTGTFNIYELDVSDPKQTFFLNSGQSGIGSVFAIDYTATIRMNAGATITMTANSIEGVEISNVGTNGRPVVVPGIPPAPQAFNGQFVQMDVETVTAAIGGTGAGGAAGVACAPPGVGACPPSGVKP